MFDSNLLFIFLYVSYTYINIPYTYNVCRFFCVVHFSPTPNGYSEGVILRQLRKAYAWHKNTRSDWLETTRTNPIWIWKIVGWKLERYVKMKIWCILYICIYIYMYISICTADIWQDRICAWTLRDLNYLIHFWVISPVTEFWILKKALRSLDIVPTPIVATMMQQSFIGPSCKSPGHQHQPYCIHKIRSGIGSFGFAGTNQWRILL